MSKLVRDTIPQIIKQKGQTPIIHIADSTEYQQALYKKLEEEVQEFIKDETKEEVADILEVIKAINTLHKWDEKEIEEIRLKKETTNGAFTQRIILDDILR